MVCPVMGRACPVDAAGWDRSWWMYREQLDREQLALKAALNAPTTTGNACTGNARLPGGEGFPRLSRELLSGSGLSFGLERLRLAFRREIWRIAWKFNAGRSHLLPYDAGLAGHSKTRVHGNKEDGRTRE